jgi:hypothetical protein
VDLGALVGEQVKEFSSQHPDRNVLLELPAGDVKVRADPFRVGQVVANLVSNAIKYSPVGSPVDVKVATAGNQAIVSVRDEGQGIPASARDGAGSLHREAPGGGDVRAAVARVASRGWLDVLVQPPPGQAGWGRRERRRARGFVLPDPFGFSAHFALILRREMLSIEASRGYPQDIRRMIESRKGIRWPAES